MLISKLTAILLLLSCCFITKSLQAQNSTELENSYKVYFETPEEIVHLHLNKTTYVVGEEIWFTAYMYDQKNGKPSLETKNLICGIYDINGKQINKERFFVSEGQSRGESRIGMPK